MTDDEIKANCEARFQRGEPRTQLVLQGYLSLEFRSFDSPRLAALCFETGRIFARRKQRDGVYRWVEIKVKS